MHDNGTPHRDVTPPSVTKRGRSARRHSFERREQFLSSGLDGLALDRTPCRGQTAMPSRRRRRCTAGAHGPQATPPTAGASLPSARMPCRRRRAAEARARRSGRSSARPSLPQHRRRRHLPRSGCRCGPACSALEQYWKDAFPNLVDAPGQASCLTTRCPPAPRPARSSTSPARGRWSPRTRRRPRHLRPPPAQSPEQPRLRRQVVRARRLDRPEGAGARRLQRRHQRHRREQRAVVDPPLVFPPQSLTFITDWEEDRAPGAAGAAEDIRLISGAPGWLTLLFELGPLKPDLAGGSPRFSRSWS